MLVLVTHFNAVKCEQRGNKKIHKLHLTITRCHNLRVPAGLIVLSKCHRHHYWPPSYGNICLQFVFFGDVSYFDWRVWAFFRGSARAITMQSNLKGLLATISREYWDGP